MNLIEQLGGYEKAKWWELHLANAESKGIHHTGSNSALRFTLNELRVALLQYRRQHNIFESGDPVVSRCADKETRIFTYQETIGKNILVKCKKGKGYCYPKKWFSHATDAEIEVGKRLEVG